MPRTRLVTVGACSIDTILTVPRFPGEDSKLRASSFSRRRGGNSPNTLEVLSQLLQLDGRDDVELNLVAALPARNSRDIDFIQHSFYHPSDPASTATAPKVNLEHCLYREDFTEPVSSYIISSAATCSRTIINHNALPEMTFEEFVSASKNVCDHPFSSSSSKNDVQQIWFHFEGRIPDVTLQCIRHLRNQPSLQSTRDRRLIISVELEKPEREGLQELAFEANVIFYSKAWAEDEGYSTAEECLRDQSRKIGMQGFDGRGIRDSLLICTWGSSGACAASIARGPSKTPREIAESMSENFQVTHSPAYSPPESTIVDTTGAGDTFIAGVLFGLICKNVLPELSKDDEAEDEWSVRKMIGFANGLAGRKILRDGFQVEDISFCRDL